MLYRKMTIVGALLCALIIICGCSGSGTPMAPNPGDITPGNETPTLKEGAEYPSSHMSWGLYEIHLDPVNWKADVVLKRQAEWHINVIPFLIPPYCPNNDCLVIANFGPWETPDTAQFDGILKHPFGGDVFFDGFDVRAIAILKPNQVYPSGALPYDVILNPDGFSNIWNTSPWVPTADINPFREYWTKIDKHTFENGKTASRKFIVRFPPVGEDFFFDIAVDASYEFPDLVNPDDPATSPNIWEPYEVTATMSEHLLQTQGSEAAMEITVYDWQNNPGPVSVEAPPLFPGSISAGEWVSHFNNAFIYNVTIPNSLGAGPGRYPLMIKAVDSFDGSVPDLDLITYNVFTVDVDPFTGPLPPVAVAQADKLTPWVDEQVKFNASASYDPDGQISTYQWDLDGNGTYTDAIGAQVTKSYSTPGIRLVDVMVSDLDGLTDKLDQKISIDVKLPPNDPPVASASSNTDHTSIGGTIKFFGDESYDPDGEVVEWAWDLDSDNVYGEPGIGEDQVNPMHQFNVGGDYFIWLRVRDNFGTWDKTNFPLTINVSGENIPPEAAGEASCLTPALGKSVIFTSASIDLDGFIETWEWNFDDGQGWVDATPEMGNISHAFSDPGTYDVDHRVIDNSGASDTLDTTLTIEVGGGGFTPPEPYNCLANTNTHSMQIDMKMTNLSHSLTMDICPTTSGNWLLGSGGKLVELDTWGTIVDDSFHQLIGLGPWLLSLDNDSVNGNYAYIYGAPFAPSDIQVINSSGSAIASVSLTSTAQAVTFDWAGNLWVATSSGEIQVFDESQDFSEDPCLGFHIPETVSGRIFDIVFDFYDHGLYIFAAGSNGYGQLTKINYDGSISGPVNNIFDSTVGASQTGDIIIDNSGEPGTSNCRIELFAGDYSGAVARFDSQLNQKSTSIFSFWGCKAAAFLPGADVVIVLESCCGHYFDRYLPPVDW